MPTAGTNKRRRDCLGKARRTPPKPPAETAVGDDLQSSPEAGSKTVAEKRIDAPHPVAVDVPASPPLGQTPEHAATELDCGVEPLKGQAAPAPLAVTAQIHTQAAQLAEHLRTRQQELDHREAELNARAAQLERDARTAKLWWEERVAEVQQRGGASTSQPTDQDESPRRAADALDARRRAMDEAEARLAAQLTETQNLHQQLLADRRALEEEARIERERLTTEQFRAAADLEEKRRAVQRREEQAEQSRAALEQLRQELSRIHRETLEIRLATEELWVQLAGATPPVELVQSLGRLRAQLAEHYRMASAEVEQQRERLEAVRTELSEQHEKLLRQKRQFDKWSADCRQEAQQQASRLIARSEELSRREAELREQSRHWQAQRLELQQEIRRLRSQLSARAESILRV